MNGQQVLVTGGAGFIGSHAVFQLIDRGYQPVVLDDFSAGHRNALPDSIDIIEGSVGDAALLDRVFSDRPITAVMHFAGSIVVPESVTDPGLYYHNNTVNTLTLLRRMLAAGVNRLVFSSTAAVYGDPGGDAPAMTEESPVQPINPYGQSKRMSELMMLDLSRAHGLNAVMLRYFNVAGADRKGRAGQRSRNATHLLKVAVEVVTGKRDRLTVFGQDYPTRDGTPERDYIHIDDLIGAHLCALDYLETGGKTDIFNCGYGHGTSVLEVIAAIEQVTGAPFPHDYGPRRAGDPARLVANADKIRRQLGWQPEADDLTAIVADALNWEKRL